MKYIVCYSGGHSSAIVAVETVRKYGKENVILLNHNISIKSEDMDVKRFKQEVADYLGITITYANMPGWEEKDQFDIFVEENAFKYGIQSSALCTQKLKTEPFRQWLSENFPVEKGEIRDDVKVIYGFDLNEMNRITRRIGVMAAMGYMTEFPMLWADRTIFDIEEIGIKRPTTYEIFNHANCKGCLKAGKQHWFIVYCLYPEVFERAKWAEDEIGFSILKQGFLKDFEKDFEVLKGKLPLSEKVKPQTFWAKARKLLVDEGLPCECSL